MPLHRLLWHSQESISKESPSNFTIELPECIQDSNESHLVELTDLVLTGAQNLWNEVITVEVAAPEQVEQEEQEGEEQGGEQEGQQQQQQTQQQQQQQDEEGGQEQVMEEEEQEEQEQYPIVHTITIPQGNYTNSSLLGFLVSALELEKKLFLFSKNQGKLQMLYMGTTPAKLTMSSVLAVKLGLTIYGKSHSDTATFNFNNRRASITAVNIMNVNAFMERGVVVLNGCNLTPTTLVAKKDSSNTINLLSKAVLATFKMPYYVMEGECMPDKVIPTVNFSQKICGSFTMGHNGIQCQVTDSLMRPLPFNPEGDVEVLLTIKA